MTRIIISALILLPAAVNAETRAIDTQQSKITIRVYKAGVFSVFAHDHEITASVARGSIDDSGKPTVELWVESGKLRVVDTDLSAKDRAEVQKTMEGPDVLDVSRFPEIHFRSTEAQKLDTGRWMVRGNLDLHGQS